MTQAQMQSPSISPSPSPSQDYLQTSLNWKEICQILKDNNFPDKNNKLLEVFKKYFTGKTVDWKRFKSDLCRCYYNADDEDFAFYDVLSDEYTYKEIEQFCHIIMHQYLKLVEINPRNLSYILTKIISDKINNNLDHDDIEPIIGNNRIDGIKLNNLINQRNSTELIAAFTQLNINISTHQWTDIWNTLKNWKNVKYQKLNINNCINKGEDDEKSQEIQYINHCEFKDDDRKEFKIEIDNISKDKIADMNTSSKDKDTSTDQDINHVASTVQQTVNKPVTQVAVVDKTVDMNTLPKDPDINPVASTVQQTVDKPVNKPVNNAVTQAPVKQTVNKPVNKAVTQAPVKQIVHPRRSVYFNAEVHKQMKQDIKFRIWCNYSVGLKKYYSVFIKNGLTSLDDIKLIGSDKLKEMKITKIEDRIKILNEIANLYKC